MNIFEKFITLFKVSHYFRIVLFCILTGVGALLGTDGVAEVESLRVFFDVIMWMGLIPLSIYAVILTIIGFYNVLSKSAYKPGDYNRWRDGDFEEWKKKNNVGQGKFDAFINWFDDPFKTEK